jgi:hypothetical protein
MATGMGRTERLEGWNMLVFLAMVVLVAAMVVAVTLIVL